MAVIGARISGLTCAYFLSREGIRVDIFEKEREIGGAVKFYIPEFRLPQNVFKKEMMDILNDRIKVYFNRALGGNLKLQKLEEEYDAVYVSIGAKSRIYEDLNGTYDGLDFLRKVKEGRIGKLKGIVGVIGGGNVAIDCARASIRLGAEDVYVIYRREERDMPAYKFEILESKREGVKFLFLLSPEEVVNEGNRIKVIFRKMIFTDELEKDGRRKIMFGGEEFIGYFDYLIYAIGQESEINKFFCINEIDKYFRKVKDRNIFVGGDFYREASSIIDGIGDGKFSVISILSFLTGREYNNRFWLKKVDADLPRPEIVNFPRQKIYILNLKERCRSFREVEKGISEDNAIREAKRCLKCHLES